MGNRRDSLRRLAVTAVLLAVLAPPVVVCASARAQQGGGGNVERLDALEQAAADMVAPALREVNRLREVYETARRAGDALAAQHAATDLGKAENELERTRVRALARASGRTETEIATLRNDGMGWGRVAKEVGVHPSALGVGHQGGASAKNAAKAAKKADKNNGKSNGKGKNK